VERVNKTLKQLIKNFVNRHHNDWDEYISQLCCAINTSTNESTQHTPHEIVFGKEFNFPQIIQPNQQSNELDKQLIEEYLNEIRSNQNQLHQIVNLQSQNSAKIQKKHYDKQINNKTTFEVGDLVLIENHKKEIGHTSKFENDYIGPFKIIKHSKDELNFKIKSLNDENEQWVHYNRLRKYHAKQPVNEGPRLAKRGRPRKYPMEKPKDVRRETGDKEKQTTRRSIPSHREENAVQSRLRPRIYDKNYKD